MTERRWDPLSAEWRIISAQRQGRTFAPPAAECPLCPTRPGGPPTEVPAEAYQIVVFDNRFPALRADPPEPTVPGTWLHPVAPAAGAAEVVLYTDRHDATFAGLPAHRVRRLIDVWVDRYAVLGARPDVVYVFVFENKGAAVGVTLEHPHGQIYGFPDLPPRVRREFDVAAAHLAARGSCLQCDVAAAELGGGPDGGLTGARLTDSGPTDGGLTYGLGTGARLVTSDADVLAYVPFAARFPYEVHVVPRRHAGSLAELTGPERDALAAVLLAVTGAYDELFGFPLPYVMAVRQTPTDGADRAAYNHLRVEFTPLHRAADRLKYLAGAELAAGTFLNDTLPEASAAALRAALARRTRPARRPAPPYPPVTSIPPEPFGRDTRNRGGASG